MKIRHIDHIGINVLDLKAAKTFFTDLGFKVMGEMHMEGELVEKVIGLENVSDDLVMLQAPDGQINIELVQYHSPKDQEGIQPNPANKLGIRHLAFQVDDLDKMVTVLKQKGYELVGELQMYENMWKLCYIRGPEGMLIELAQQIK